MAIISFSNSDDKIVNSLTVVKYIKTPERLPDRHLTQKQNLLFASWNTDIGNWIWPRTFQHHIVGLNSLISRIVHWCRLSWMIILFQNHFYCLYTDFRNGEEALCKLYLKLCKFKLFAHLSNSICIFTFSFKIKI